MARKISRGEKDFAAIYESFILPTSTIRLCSDDALVAERAKAQAELDALLVEKSIPAEATVDDVSLADEPAAGVDADVQELRTRLDWIDDRIDASDLTTILEVAAPSEADMQRIQKLFDTEKFDEWQVALVAACLGQPVVQVEALRKHITRGTWNHVVSQVTDLVREGNVSVPTRRAGSASSPD